MGPSSPEAGTTHREEDFDMAPYVSVHPIFA